MNPIVVACAIACWLILVGVTRSAMGWHLPQPVEHQLAPHRLTVADIQLRLAAEVPTPRTGKCLASVGPPLERAHRAHVRDGRSDSYHNSVPC